MPIATPQGTLDFKSVDAVTFVGVSSNTVIDTTTGSFGVGVDGNGPTSNLHVVGNAYISTDLTVVGDIDFSGTFNQNGAPFSSSPWTTTGADLSYTTGNVSLGKELTVTGNVSVSDDLTVTGNVAVSGTGAILVPSGTTAQQPTGINGMIRYNTETGYMEAYTGSGWGSIATPPTIQTFSPTSVAVADVNTQVFAVTGAFFDAQTTIQLQGADATLYDVTDFTFTSSGSIGFKMGTLATGQVANRPYKVVVTNGAGLSGTSTATIGLGAGVSWTSPAAGATLATFLTGTAANNTELAATDDLGGSGVIFSVPANNLPSPLTLNGSTGAITGTIGAVGTTSVTFRVTDTVSGATLDRTFSIVGVDGLYPFGSSFTFTNASATGHTGPTLTNLTDEYTPAWTDNTNFLNVSGGIQEWTVPETGSYTIKAAGASGEYRDSTYKGGRGRIVHKTFTLTKGEIIKILVGQTGTSSLPGNGTGGGGTFVMRTPYNSTASAMVVAGGGGGLNGSYYTPAIGGDGRSQTTTTNNSNAGYGGSGGTVCYGNGSNGGGLLSDGTVGGLCAGQHANGSNGMTLVGGRGFINGGNGGFTVHTQPSGSWSHGGFGGGGIPYYGDGNYGGGGGGGYTGGNTFYTAANDGGGSYYPGGTDLGVGSYNSDGYVTVTVN